MSRVKITPEFADTTDRVYLSLGFQRLAVPTPRLAELLEIGRHEVEVALEELEAIGKSIASVERTLTLRRNHGAWKVVHRYRHDVDGLQRPKNVTADMAVVGLDPILLYRPAELAGSRAVRVAVCDAPARTFLYDQVVRVDDEGHVVVLGPSLGATMTSTGAPS